jgi:hypothetical protein
VRRGAAAWQAVVDRQAASGVSRKVFCEREGIPRSSFETWRGRLAARAAEARFVALVPAPAEGPGWDVELSLPGGVTLRLRG